MSDSVLTVLKLAFLAGLYLFLARVVRAVWVEIHAERGSLAERVRSGNETSDSAAQTEAVSSAREQPAEKKTRRKGPILQLKIVEPPERRGRTFEMSDEMTIGRAAGCAVSIDDPLISQLHARLFRRDGQYFIEDLGSTNGTFLNRKKVGGPIPVAVNDRLSMGDTVVEIRK
jgi:pSer/pThr/pTyr-binding forkhead associated (FHA) protein